MKTLIDSNRLARLLRSNGFALVSGLGESRIWYARPSEHAELWEQILIELGGKHGQAVAASVVVNACYADLGVRGTFEDRFVTETAPPPRLPPEPPTGGLTILKRVEEASAWEHRVAEICPDKVRAFAGEVGPILQARTAVARTAVNGYLNIFGTRDWRELRARFERRAITSELREAQRIATTPPTIQVYNGKEFYTTIILGMMLYSDDVEGRQIITPGINPWPDWRTPYSDRDWGLAWRIEILADRMLNCYPNAMPSTLPD
jgi:hypothetical protein